jgi:hypothetical protein
MKCYTETAKITVNEEFCDNQSYGDDIEKKYNECYVLFDKYRDRKYCENKYPENTEKKYKCAYCVIQSSEDLKNQEDDVMDTINTCISTAEADELVGVGGDYCYFMFPWKD